ncbi:hypothetical protein IV203_010951 [Nitzschia inconspicua]|uniref:Uncharacterized protein n=1 Tax=Nitzschia inconspicua TaxID=303405 RepID=A0A9K3KXS5_9STRA|nr:hypothetical protein IV203_010951 [Nitzschia inconspicua]
MMMFPKSVSSVLTVLLLLLATTISLATRLGETTVELPSSRRQLQKNADPNTRIPCDDDENPCNVKEGVEENVVKCAYSNKYEEYECYSDTMKATDIAGSPPCKDGFNLVKMSTWWWMCKEL